MPPAAVRAQDFAYTTTDREITITGYTGPGGDVRIPGRIDDLPVTSIGRRAFAADTSLTTVTIPDSVTGIETEAFEGCDSLTGVYFQGNAPSVGPIVFAGANNVTVYRLPGTTGWGTTLGDRPTAPWYLPYPVVLSFRPSFGVRSNGFAFTISWATNADVLVETATNLANPVWVPIGTNTLSMGSDPATDGWAYFSDPQRTNHPARFYRVWTGPANPDPARLAWIRPGTFTMGSPPDEPARLDWEGPQVTVTISRGFWMGKHEVTQGEYLEVVGSNPSHFRNGTAAESAGGPVTNELRHPVERVTWIDATNYCGLLTERERLAGRLPVGYEYRLPTEAQWEYACRAGTTTPFEFGSELRSGNRHVNFDGHAEYPPCGGHPYWCANPSGIWLGRTAEVGGYIPNAWGLYDMHGNVWEWCQDWYGDYPGGPLTDPAGPGTGSIRVYRSGSCLTIALFCRSAYRYGDLPESTYHDLGFRVALVAVP